MWTSPYKNGPWTNINFDDLFTQPLQLQNGLVVVMAGPDIYQTYIPPVTDVTSPKSFIVDYRFASWNCINDNTLIDYTIFNKCKDLIYKLKNKNRFVPYIYGNGVER